MKYFRPLSEPMVQKLRQCHHAELNGDPHNHFTMEDMNYAVAPLYKRGLIEVKKRLIDDKILHCIYITEAGKKYLENLDATLSHKENYK